ncbi:SpaA isopeptide-forming pilin-related protein [uncultured Ruminococcus sp.]|uniref:SpaA isopeptide-forming pilin-related protein n=1 Tax=uncultured Ruminococcus sp. TaxID=165186 RepID=UPI0026655CF2|nr:SpaA isopeptide-forming pilin-related protein [uncultured Ruminococcus sp.]
MKKLRKLKSAVAAVFKPKKLASLAIALTTVFAMLPIANISASAYSYTGLDEIGGKVLIQSSENALVLIDNGSAGKLDAYKFLIDGEVGYCIDPQLPAQKTSGKTMEFSQFSGETGKEVIKLDPYTTNQKEKALIAGLSVFYGGYGDYFSTFSNGGKTAKSIMDSYINGVYSSDFKHLSNADDKYYYLSHYAESQLYHELVGDSTNWKTWSSYKDINTMINGLVEFANNIAKSTGDYSAILRSCQMNNYYICQPKGKDGTFCQHLIVRIPKKAKLALQKSGTSDEIKNLTEQTKDKDYLNFAGAQYTIYNKSDKKIVAVAELNKNGNIAKILYSYSNSEWITKNYFELDAGDYVLKETKAPNNGKYYAIDDAEYSITITSDDCKQEKTLDVLNVNDIERVRLNLKKESANPDLTDNNSCYDLGGALFAVFSNQKSAYDYLADNSKKNNIVRYFITDSKGNCKAISADGNSWDYSTSSELYKFTYSKSLYAVEIEAPNGFKKYNKAVNLTLTSETYGGYAVLSATIVDEPMNDPVYILLHKKDELTGQYTNMENAEFTVSYYKGYYYSEDELSDKTPERQWVLKTDSRGYTYLDEAHRADSDFGEPFYLTSDENPNPAIPLGTVTIQETKAPQGFKLNSELFIRQIKIDELTGSVMTFNEIEVPEPRDTGFGNLSIYKTADDSKHSNNTAKNVWFRITSDDGITDEYIATTAKGLDGVATLKNLPVYKLSGEYVYYTISELGYKNSDGTYSVPDRYVAPTSKTITLKANVTLTFTFANRLATGTLRLTKTDSSDTLIDGSGWKLYKADGTAVECSKNSNGKYSYKSTGASATDCIATNCIATNGSLTIDKLPVGDYYLVESITPTGYMPYGKKLEFKISANAETPLLIQFTVKDNKTMLSETGGVGRAPLYYIGIALALISTFFISKAKNRKENQYEIKK